MQTPAPAPDRDTDLNRQQLAAFDQFLDSHQELAQELRKDPSLVNNQEFLASHSDLQHYLEQHPEVREGLTQNPNAVLNQEQRFDRREDRQEDRRPDQDQRQDRDMDRSRDLDRDRDHRVGDSDVTRGELKNMDAFMDGHPEIAEQLRKDPSLVNNKKFVADHPALQQFLANHPGVREEYKENPNAFMNREERFDQREDRRLNGDRDVTRGELRNMDVFMDAHPEIAEQLKKDPSLVDNKQFVAGHPALQQFLANHPGVREEYKENPNAFMHQEQRFDRREDFNRRDRDVTGGELSSFHEFLQGHGTISTELSKNPSLATNKEYLANHPELSQYLTSHPKVNEELGENPQSFLKSSQQFESTTKPMPKPLAAPKTK
jgi:phage-related protein